MYLRQAIFPDDLNLLSQLMTATEQRQITRERLASLAQSGLEVSRCQLAIGEDGQAAGYTWLLRQETFPAAELQLMMGFLKQQNALAYTLLIDAEAYAHAHHYSRLSTSIELQNEDDQAVSFLKNQGFAVVAHQIQSQLSIPNFNDTPFVRYLTQAKLNGIRFFTFGQLGDTLENRQKLYSLHRELAADAPNRDPSPFPEFGQYQSGRIESEGFEPDGCLIALAKDEWIGMAMLEVWDGSPIALNTITGVLEPWRNLGLAQALKLVTIRGARSFGIETLVTINAAANEAIRAINQKMGYQSERVLIRLEKQRQVTTSYVS